MDADRNDRIDAFYADVGERIKVARQRAGLTQGDLASALGLTRSSVTNLEAGRQRVPLHVFAWVSEILRVPPGNVLPLGPSFADARDMPDVREHLANVPDSMRDFVETTLAKAVLADRRKESDDLAES